MKLAHGQRGGTALLLAAAVLQPSLALVPPAPGVRLTIVPGRFAIGSARFDDRAGVDGWLRTRGERVAAIDHCASSGVTRLLWAVERYRPPVDDSIGIRSMAASHPERGGLAPATWRPTRRVEA